MTTRVDPVWFRDPSVRDRLVAAGGGDGEGRGVAAMWLHGAGRDHLLRLAEQPAGPQDVLDHMARLDVSPLARALGSDAAEWNYEAASGARDVLRVLTGAGVPWPVAVRRAAAAYGADASSLRGFQRRMSEKAVLPQVADDEGLRAVCESAARRVSSGVSKEWVDHPDGRRWVNRDEDGQFAEQNAGVSRGVKEVDGRLVMVEEGREREAEAPREDEKEAEAAPQMKRETLGQIAAKQRRERRERRNRRKARAKAESDRRRAAEAERAKAAARLNAGEKSRLKAGGKSRLKAGEKSRLKAGGRSRLKAGEKSRFAVRGKLRFRNSSRLRLTAPPPPSADIGYDYDPPPSSANRVMDDIRESLEYDWLPTVVGPAGAGTDEEIRGGFAAKVTQDVMFYDVLDNAIAFDVPAHIVMQAAADTMPMGDQRGVNNNSKRGARLNVGVYYRRMFADGLYGNDPLRIAQRKFAPVEEGAKVGSSTVRKSAESTYSKLLSVARSEWDAAGRDAAPEQNTRWYPNLNDSPYGVRRYFSTEALENYESDFDVGGSTALHDLEVMSIESPERFDRDRYPYVDLPVIRMFVTNIPVDMTSDYSIGMPNEWVDLGLGGAEWAIFEDGTALSAGAGALTAAQTYAEVLGISPSGRGSDIVDIAAWRRALEASEFGVDAGSGEEMAARWNSVVSMRAEDSLIDLETVLKSYSYVSNRGVETPLTEEQVEALSGFARRLVERQRWGVTGEAMDQVAEFISNSYAFKQDAVFSQRDRSAELASYLWDSGELKSAMRLGGYSILPMTEPAAAQGARGYHPMSQALATVDTPVLVPRRALEQVAADGSTLPGDDEDYGSRVQRTARTVLEMLEADTGVYDVDGGGVVGRRDG